MLNKKGVILVLALFLATMIFTSCSNDQGAQSEEKVFAVVPKLVSHPYFKLSAEGMEQAAKDLNVDARFVGPQKADAAKQVSTIENLIVQGVSGIAISPVDANAIKPVIKQAMDKGIKVITFDADAPNSERLAYIGTGNKSAGKKAGEAMAKKLNGKGKVAIMTGQLGAENLNQRIAGFKEGLAGTDIKVVKVEANGDDMSLALSQAEALLQAYDLDGIFASSASGAPAAAQALKSKGKVGDVVVIGFDDMPQTLNYIREGVVYATIAQRPDLMGYKSVELLLNLSNGEKVDNEFIDTGVSVVTKENIDSYKK
ncbi:monosaccharide ABC transporter substrate-binding protein (CUT2 family) [Orenia metallireducens]|jgi:ribose transport system substrate-binding protein|uniref:Monosaccharide ABC transporter substrate-binding protein, CUT2 family n=1 Tax=Orenia metallireducens TaxID=1413210 RepID=A0A285IHQ3_9FIRM|nr:sugar-binding protein [Orenia metallireducens]PRX17479.1 monosaccharide ABC transporter substrate-binding protein (CUT2 family) [Orenia metallireducens]SNY47492.1 monosaccharide ABC transporter substrate-binding protein, CUT2 family [Orenia metallireducens]